MENEGTKQELAVMQVSHLPQIKENIKIIGEEVKRRIEAENLDTLVATNDSIQSLKKLRAQFNKELALYNGQDKAVRDALQAPYKEIKDQLKTEVLDQITTGVGLLSDKIGVFETKVKNEKRDAVKTFFEELKVAENIPWIEWEKLGIEINLSTSLKKYKESVNEYLSKMCDDLALIAQEEHPAEILVAYKGSLNVAQAITTVKVLKKQAAIETERIRQETIKGRIKSLKDLGMVKAAIGDMYEYDGRLPITTKEIEEQGIEEWTVTYIGAEGAIKEIEAAALALLQAEETANTIQQTPAAAVGAPQTVKPAAPVAEVASDPDDRIVTATFEATAPYGLLKALGQFMRDNDIEYINL